MATGGAKQNQWADKKIFTTGEAAQVCKVSQQTIIRCFDSGRLTGFRVPGSKFRRIPRAELMRFMQSNGIPLDPLEGGRKRILIVDDDAAVNDLLVDVLEREDAYEVKTALTGYEAGLLTESFKPHLMILDYMLPDINGNVVCERVKGRESTKDTRIVFISGVVDEREVRGLLEAGADDFIRKPFDIGALVERINELLEIQAG
jgi:excisionase family DNA binding protein